MSILKTSLGLLTASLLVSGAATAQTVEDFEAGNPNNWQIDFDGTFNGFAISSIPGTVAGGGNPGSALSFLNLSEQLPGPWFLNSPSNADFSGDLRAKGVESVQIDFNFNLTATSPFGNRFLVVLADDMGTAEVTDDVMVWNFGAGYSYLGFGPGQLPGNTWNNLSFAVDTSSTVLPAGWSIGGLNGAYAGDPDAAWNALVQDVDYIAFTNGTPWGGNNFGAADVLFDNITLTTGAVGTPYCFCDGSGTAAPCANPGSAGNGCANSVNASGANLSALGNASAGASTLVLSCSGAAPGQPGLYFQGTGTPGGGSGITFGDGLRCAGGTVIRLEVVTADGSGNSSTSIDLAVKGGVTGPQTLNYQHWYRDPIGSPCGADFNTSNGLTVVWGS